MKYVGNAKGIYDYVVVGAGSAGAVMASRLAESRSHRVLLIEEGGKNQFIGIAMPAAMGLPLLSSRYNYKYKGAPEGEGEDSCIYQPRGRGLGGSSSVNGMNWVRGNRADFDNWASLGLDGWDYQSILPYFKKAESFEEGVSAYRGDSGPITVERSPANNVLDQSFLRASASVGLPENPDHNAASQAGPHRIQRNIGNGRRMDTAFAYLRRRRLGDNLHVLLNTRVERLRLDGRKCVGLELRRKGQHREYIVVDGEVVLSTGALITPKILQLSGIGNADELKKHDIPIAAHLPAVGNNLSDHTCFCLSYSLNNQGDSIASELGYSGRAILGTQWLLTRKGLGASNLFEVGGFFSTTGNDDYPDIQIECIPMSADFGDSAIIINPGFQCFISLQRPTSTGKVWLQSADPSAVPVFKFNYLSSEADRRLSVRAIKFARQLMMQKPLARHIDSETGYLAEATTDKEILRIALRNAETNYHPCSTARMGTNQNSVVNNHGIVHGFENLRVVDASIIPRIPTANLNAPVIMIAEKIAAEICGSD